MNKTKFIVWGFLVFFILLTLGIVGKVSASKKQQPVNVNLEATLTPEQRAVINAIRQAQADLEKSKAEFVQLINDAKATAIGANLNPNIKTEYIAHGVNGSWAIRDRANPVPVLLGFRGDRIVVWKFADE